MMTGSSLGGVLADIESRSTWMPRAASTVAHEVDDIYSFILWLCVLFFVGIVGVTVYFAWKYRRQSEDQRTSPIHHSTKLELAWSILPTILLLVMFYWGFKVWMKMGVPPDDTLDVRVTARQWTWQFDYPREGFSGANELVVPVGKAVKLTMTSEDVLHSFFVPEFRIKKDVIPKRYSVVWFEAPETGVFNVFCTEYCGKDHSRMITRVRVVSQEDYQKWVATEGMGDAFAKMPLSEKGKIYFNRFGCGQCHSLDGSANTGPALNGKYGTMEQCADGTEIKVDDNYIRDSIENPMSVIVKGYQPKMPSFKGKIKTEQITAIIEYLKSIGK